MFALSALYQNYSIETINNDYKRMDRKQNYLAFRIQRQEKRVFGSSKRYNLERTEGDFAGQIWSRRAEIKARAD